jgi:hypothetical protein
MSAFAFVVPAVLVFGVLLGVASGVIGGFGVASYRSMSARATGTVIDRDDSDGIQGVPVVAFMPLGGPETRFRGGNDMGLFGPGIGRTVRVRYNPRNPAEARIASFYQSYLVQGCSLLVGLAIGVISYIGLLR